MAQSKSFFDDVKKEIECPVCQEQFSGIKEPKLLKCFHTFCKSCLEGWLRQQGGETLSCPKCRQITECPNNNINNLPSNLFYKQMVDIVEAYSGQGKENSSLCGSCDENRSLSCYCSECSSFLCQECAGAHRKLKVFSSHQVKEIGNFGSNDVEDYARRANVCNQHKDDLRFFCETCEICICRDCAILDHVDHRKLSLEKGLEKKRSEIGSKMLEVEENGTRLMRHKTCLEKRRLQIDNSFEQATKTIHGAAETCINLIRQHEESVTEQLIKQKGTFQVSFVNEMTRLDGKLTEIHDSLEFGREVLSRHNLPEILNIEKLLERRLRELSAPFQQMLDLTEVRYIPNDASSLIKFPGKLVTSSTEPSLSVAEGKGLTKALEGERATFTIITKDSRNQTTYSEIDQINVEINSKTKGTLKTTITDNENGHYQVMYMSNEGGDFNVSITVKGEAIKGSPFRLTVTETTGSSHSKFEDTSNDEESEASSSMATFLKQQRRMVLSSKLKAAANSSCWHSRSLKDSLSGGASRKTECPICLRTLTNPRTLKCKHEFCTNCIETALKHNNRCPVCKEVQGFVRGNQPKGEMRIQKTFDRLPGYHDCGAIVIHYSFPSGIQGQEHPNPGRRYDGTQRTAYLPDNREGREVLQLLRRAFDARLVFTVGTSVTTGRPNQVTWNGIHHKTSMYGGPEGFGYPDPHYLRRVKEELAAKGIF